MTPTIYKIAYAQASTGEFILFYNDGNVDVSLDKFDTEAEIDEYLKARFERVGKITDYGLYIRK